MAEPLKNSFGPDIPGLIADMVTAAYPAFDRDRFVRDCLVEYDSLELTPRARRIADALGDHLPDDRGQALSIITASLGPEIEQAELTGMESFRYLPFVYFVADEGLDHFELAMAAQYELTKRFTAEFSIRAYLETYPKETLARLREWAGDENVHVRRLVSEGSRPRLPWAPRLRTFQADPGPVIELLEMLKDDDQEYVRRSVANNLNDISKDHPDLVADIAGRWLNGASPERRRLIRHGLRTLIKQGHLGALAVLGYGPESPVRIADVRIDPLTVAIGGKVRITIDLENPEPDTHGGLVDLIVHFIKANGSVSAKVFKGGERTLEGHARTTVSKTISLQQHSTRTHHAGTHVVEIQLNGTIYPAGGFELT